MGHFLVWQEPLDDCLPGEYAAALEQEELRAKQILIPDKATYEKPGLDQPSLSWQVFPSRLSLSI